MPGVKYVGPVLDGSGYGAAARNYVRAIHDQGYPIVVDPITFEDQPTDLGEDGVLMKYLSERTIGFDKVIVHSTPDVWRFFTSREPDCYCIGQTVWETTRLHPVWTKASTCVDEVWVPSRWNVEVFHNSGVVCPIRRVPHTLPFSDPPSVPPLTIDGVHEQDFVFYSIFEWTERKNPYGLIAAYFSAFSGVHDVVLVLRAFIGEARDQAGTVDSLIQSFKKQMNLHHYPRIVVLEQRLSDGDLFALHERGDCFVLLQRGEGWGLPHFEAAALGTPVITPRFGGQTDFLSPETSYLVDYTLRPVTGMSWSPFYQGTQWWCEPDLQQAGRFMKEVFENRELARARGRKSKKFIHENFNSDRVGAQIVDYLTEIDGRRKSEG